MLCFIRLTAATRASKTQEKNNKEIRHRGGYLLSLLLFVCNLGKKKKEKHQQKTTLSSLCIYSINYFRSLLPPEAGLGKRATDASHFAFISQQF